MPRVSELLVVAAPSCCGKTRFLDRVFDGRHDDLLARMGICDPIDSYLPVLARELPEYRGASIPRMILHLALPVVPLFEGRLSRLADEPGLEFVPACEKVTALTLLASEDALRARLQLRYRRTRKLLLKSIHRYISVRKRLGKLTEIYGDPANLVVAYEMWFRYVESLPNLANRWLVTAEDEYELREPAEWGEIRSAYFGASPGLALPQAAPAAATGMVAPKLGKVLSDGTQ